MLDGEIVLPIVSERVILVPFEEKFITDAYLLWLNDKDLMCYSGQRFLEHDRASSLRFLAGVRGTAHFFWAVQRRSDGLFIGTMTAYVESHHQVADVGILIGHPAVRGTGMGRDAWGTAMRYLFSTEDLRKITGGTSALNTPMLRIFRHWGMTLEGMRREHELINGVPTDVLLFGILRSEWEARKGQ